MSAIEVDCGCCIDGEVSLSKIALRSARRPNQQLSIDFHDDRCATACGHLKVCSSERRLPASANGRSRPRVDSQQHAVSDRCRWGPAVDRTSPGNKEAVGPCAGTDPNGGFKKHCGHRSSRYLSPCGHPEAVTYTCAITRSASERTIDGNRARSEDSSKEDRRRVLE